MVRAEQEHHLLFGPAVSDIINLLGGGLSMSETGKNKGGRPRVDATPITVRVPPGQLDGLDAWIADRPAPKPSRPEAIREAVSEHLKAKGYLK